MVAKAGARWPMANVGLGLHFESGSEPIKWNGAQDGFIGIYRVGYFVDRVSLHWLDRFIDIDRIGLIPYSMHEYTMHIPFAVPPRNGQKGILPVRVWVALVRPSSFCEHGI